MSLPHFRQTAERDRERGREGEGRMGGNRRDINLVLDDNDTLSH